MSFLVEYNIKPYYEGYDGKNRVWQGSPTNDFMKWYVENDKVTVEDLQVIKVEELRTKNQLIVHSLSGMEIARKTMNVTSIINLI